MIFPKPTSYPDSLQIGNSAAFQRPRPIILSRHGQSPLTAAGYWRILDHWITSLQLPLDGLDRLAEWTRRKLRRHLTRPSTHCMRRTGILRRRRLLCAAMVQPRKLPVAHEAQSCLPLICRQEYHLISPPLRLTSKNGRPLSSTTAETYCTTI